MQLKYQYHLKTWGGFYNTQHKHGFKEGDYLFNTEVERGNYINLLEDVSKKLNAHVLVTSLSEGYSCSIRTVCHRVSSYKDKEYYTTWDLGVNYPFSTAKYIIKDKWYPGFNDYPLGEDFDYENKDFKIVSEWITGAMDVTED